MRHPRCIPAREDGIALSDIRVPELCEGGFPVGTRANTASQAESRKRNQKRKELAPEELNRTRRDRCTVRNSNDDGGSNAHVHVTR